MKIGDLINACGENIAFQNLDQCASDLDYSAKSGTRIKFCTDQPLDLNGTRDLGLIVWLPREAVKSALQQQEARDGRE